KPLFKGETERLITGFDGRLERSVPIGRYMLESERPVEFQAKSYRWMVAVRVTALEPALVDLSSDNATVEAVAPSRTESPGRDLPTLFADWQQSVVTVWGEAGRGSGFLVDEAGL